MVTLEGLKFAHRKNPDRTVDSICTRCFKTIANVENEADLPRIEQRHFCDPPPWKQSERLNRGYK